MSGKVGREALLKKNGTVIAGLRNVTMSWAGESIDLTAGDDSGKRTLADLSAQEQIDISADGIMKNATLRALVLGSSSKMLEDITLEFAILNSANTTPAQLSGNFMITSYEEGMPYKDAITFSFALESSEAWTYTDEAA